MAHEITPGAGSRTKEDLQDLVLNSSDVEDFLHELAVVAASELSSPGQEVFCGVTLLRQKKAATIASSDDHARAMDEVQYAFDDGPCLTAIRESVTVHAPDLRHDDRWPEYAAAALKGGIGAMLAVPFLGEGDAKAGLNLYSTHAHGFSGDSIGRAEKFAIQANTSLRLALRIAQLTDARNDLTIAMKSRTTIDLAAGVIMAQNRCSQATAMAILKNASSARNVKLRDVAATVIASVSSDTAVTTHFDA
ncbi:ANTAR domain-containing protein [Arthrobacter sp. NPDC093125]|uniref:ANTAR domain-containing protein n=1 Tax=Arthrobacter sp. NPDC093125 TaxID=3363944 RepID=UPI0038255247